jgi:glutamate formiminotransferase/formiminotetrahydrofolate cyclodeaminase
MSQQLVECVPNFSEGRDLQLIKQITDSIETVDGVALLDVDPGKATNRTVVTIAGPPEAVIEAAFRAVRKASELIDMRKHSGEHPRFGATDVLPLIPVANITMEETVEYARLLAKRIGDEVPIPVYCYEHAAFAEERRNLATVRSGEYEGLQKKLSDPRWKPDFGEATFNPRTGSIAVGARDFLVAYNVNLNTTSTRRANSVAFDVREQGRVKREGDPVTGKVVRDADGKPLRIPGTLKAVKAIGWYIEEYGISQISMNLTDLSVTPVHVAFDEVATSANTRGMRATGSELVGLIPLKSMLDAGKYFLRKQQRSLGISDAELIKIAVKSMGLDDLYEFKPEEKIIEYALAAGSQKRLVDLTLGQFTSETASESPAPGGGSVSAYLGSIGTALGTMVANLSSHKRGWDDRWEEFSTWAEKGKALQEKLLGLVDKDTEAFNQILTAIRLPKASQEEKDARDSAIQEATKNAILVPYQVMETAFASFELLEAMATIGNPNSVSDAGVGAMAVRASIRGAFLNVKINAEDCTDEEFVSDILQGGRQIEDAAAAEERKILEVVEAKIADS